MFLDKTEVERFIEKNGPPNKPKPKTHRKMQKDAGFLEGSTVLDVGCGIGHLYPYLKDSVEEYVGLDASTDMLKAAESYFPEATWIQGDIYSLEDHVDRFDTVYAISLLIHFQDHEKAIRQLWSRTRSRYVFLIPTGRREEIVKAKPGLIYHQTTIDNLKLMIRRLPDMDDFALYPLTKIKIRITYLWSDIRLHYFAIVDRRTRPILKL